ncbi:Uncharacterised protein [Mycobacterium tuberculosis]|uniref:Uncharacterized protein n=1 Tax=Mycobacterium tuberculosis TaxID=1773 RepID=A0A916L980_MYCTX|nr:Uncharacterised protein [Mycobacterium tuberculosis]
MDLPTLGRPTTATTGAAPDSAISESSSCQSLSSTHVPSWVTALPHFAA